VFAVYRAHPRYVLKVLAADKPAISPTFLAFDPVLKTYNT
jgi:hypothetical protein